jgi:hypothetical protein
MRKLLTVLIALVPIVFAAFSPASAQMIQENGIINPYRGPLGPHIIAVKQSI